MRNPAVRRSACDQCRAKRVRCLRAQDSLAPCARCSYIGARCITSASRQPGRPPKQRLLAGGDGSSEATAGSDLAGAASKPAAVHPHSPRDPTIAHEPQPEFWIAAPGDSPLFFGSPSMVQSPAPPDEDSLSIVGQLSNPLQLQERLGADDELDAMLHMAGGSSTALDVDIDPLFDHADGALAPISLSRCLSAASSLAGFREEIDQCIAMVDTFYSDPSAVLQRCRDDDAGRDVENPAAALLTYSKEFTDIIQSLTPAAQLHPKQTDDSLSTEIVLLALSSYLALMRLFDSLFDRIYKYLCEVPPETYESLKVKSVLRIGGVSSLQDMPLKAYAMGILDAIQAQVRTLERCMGIPVEYCLSGDAAALHRAATSGIFSRADRAQLFWAVIAQEDVKSRRGSKSYTESIRVNIRESMAFLND